MRIELSSVEARIIHKHQQTLGLCALLCLLLLLV